MTIEFNKKELDYLALKVAEIIYSRANHVSDLSNRGYDSAADKPIDELVMSVRLRNCLKAAGVLDWTPREIAYYSKRAWARFRNLGRKTFFEFEQLLDSVGLQFGKEYFPRDENYDIIVQKPFASYER